MFKRIRQTIKILSYKNEPIHPDFPSSATDEVEVTRISRTIGGFIEACIILLAAGFVGRYLHDLSPGGRTALSTGVLTGVATALLALLGNWLFDSLNERVRLSLKLGERLAPYFGHKLTESLRILTD